MSELKQISAQMPIALYQQLEASAKRNERTVSGELRVAIAAHLDKEGDKGGVHDH